MSAQDQIRKLLINDFYFALISTKETNFGKRLLLRSEAGLEAQLGNYRVCFYAAEIADTEKPFPANRNPLCFGTEHKSDISSFLEKSLGIKPKPKRKSAAALKAAAPTLFEL